MVRLDRIWAICDALNCTPTELFATAEDADTELEG